MRLLLEVFAAGLPFFAFLMLTDPVTSPRTSRGLTIYDAFTALLSFLFRLLASPVQFLLVGLLAANLGLAIQNERSRAKPILTHDISSSAALQRRTEARHQRR